MISSDNNTKKKKWEEGHWVIRRKNLWGKENKDEREIKAKKEKKMCFFSNSAFLPDC